MAQGSVLWQDEMNARSNGEVAIDIGGAGAHFQQDQLQHIDDQVRPGCRMQCQILHHFAAPPCIC